jgi:hypothetical protein
MNKITYLPIKKQDVFTSFASNPNKIYKTKGFTKLPNWLYKVKFSNDKNLNRYVRDTIWLLESFHPTLKKSIYPKYVQMECGYSRWVWRRVFKILISFNIIAKLKKHQETFEYIGLKTVELLLFNKD